MRVIGIESSCDETAVAVYDQHRGLLSHRLFSQVAMHQAYGGVVPELASRDHVRRLLPLVRETLAEAGSDRSSIDGVAYTAGPGLIGALLVGAAFARSLAFAWGKRALAIHHLEGHLLAPLLEDNPPAFPFLALLVSGGHTQLVDVAGLGHYRILGETLDDAAGEAFDKTAKMLGLPYPGGAALARLAEAGRSGRFEFPRPMLDRPGLEFSFSGLKTAALVALRGRALTTGSGRRRARLPGGGDRYARGEVSQGIASYGAWAARGGRRRRRESETAGTPGGGRRRLRSGVVFSETRILHRQRGDDCAGRLPADGGQLDRKRRRCGHIDPGAGALAARRC